jgi:hypothetical protein
MRIRSTKPEFWRSRRIAAVSWDARLVLKGLESFVDDNGVGKDDIALIVGDIFSRDMFANPRETVARVSEAISELHEGGLVWRYEADGTHLLYIAWWESVQRIDKPGKGRLPRPDGTFEYGESQIRESVARARESVAPGTGEQGNRGTGEQSPSSAIADAIPDKERPEVKDLCERLAKAVEANGVPKPEYGKSWLTSARLLLDKDGYTVQQVEWMIDWATNDEFWRSNILSMPKLREKFPQLKLRAVPETAAKPKVDPDWHLR